MKSSNEVFYIILDRASGDAVGMAALINIHLANRSVEIGNIVYTARMQRSPSATEAMYLLARHVFEELGYRRYEWKCNALNAPSRAAALRYGFRFEGVFRQHMIVKGRTATPHGSPCWMESGRSAKPPSSAGWTQRTFIPTASRDLPCKDRRTPLEQQRPKSYGR